MDNSSKAPSASSAARGIDWRWVAKLGVVAFGATFLVAFVLAFVVVVVAP